MIIYRDFSTRTIIRSLENLTLTVILGAGKRKGAYSPTSDRRLSDIRPQTASGQGSVGLKASSETFESSTNSTSETAEALLSIFVNSQYLTTSIVNVRIQLSNYSFLKIDQWATIKVRLQHRKSRTFQ